MIFEELKKKTKTEITESEFTEIARFLFLKGFLSHTFFNYQQLYEDYANQIKEHGNDNRGRKIAKNYIRDKYNMSDVMIWKILKRLS